MNINVYILNASGNLTPYKNSLLKYAKSTVEKVQKKIELKNVDIIIKESENPEFFKDVDGVGGFCPSANFAQISLDLKHPIFRKNTKSIIERTLAHELHHIMRRQANIPIFGGSLLECLFSEGLADYFSFEITGDFPVWSISLNKKDKARLMKKAKLRFKKKVTYKDYDDWFLVGSKKNKIPRWTGYALGLELVKECLENHKDKSAASLIAISAEKALRNINKK
jgi:uncharacterized protein YjaZ